VLHFQQSHPTLLLLHSFSLQSLYLSIPPPSHSRHHLRHRHCLVAREYPVLLHTASYPRTRPTRRPTLIFPPVLFVLPFPLHQPLRLIHTCQPTGYSLGPRTNGRRQRHQHHPYLVIVHQARSNYQCTKHALDNKQLCISPSNRTRPFRRLSLSPVDIVLVGVEMGSHTQPNPLSSRGGLLFTIFALLLCVVGAAGE